MRGTRRECIHAGSTAASLPPTVPHMVSPLPGSSSFAVFGFVVFILAVLLAAAPVAAQDDDSWGDDSWEDDPWGDDELSPWSFHGFVEGAVGLRTRDHPLIARDAPLGELRLQLEAVRRGERAVLRLKADAVADGVEEEFRGELREANISLPLGARGDLRAGRQVLTWGTGDLLFLNDLFPKDWQSFLSGRDDEYLKAPADAVRLSRFGESANVDFVWMPLFTPDEYIDGSRLAYFDAAAGGLVAAPPVLRGRRPARTPANGEAAVRIHGLRGATEWALYGYRGFHGRPTAYDPVRDRATFSRLNAVGASLRAPLAGGIYNLEVAWYDSEDDRRGDDPNVPNSELRLIAGYEREMATNFTLGLQYYLEWMQEYGRFRAAWPHDHTWRPDERRHLVTVRPTWRMMRDNLVVSVMTFVSPGDDDLFFRPTVDYRHSDRLRISAGANIFAGRDRHTFYGQFEDDSSIFTRVRYSF